jgi:drug/metabolite transporter (DMT)-like permease
MLRVNSPRGEQWIGPALAVVGVLGFSFKAILIKLAYAWAPIDAVTLLALRMLYATPFFALMASFATRRRDIAAIAKGDWLRLVWLGFIGYYLASLVDFMGLQYVSAGLERLMLYLYPTIVVVLSALLFKQRITGRILLALALS